MSTPASTTLPPTTVEELLRAGKALGTPQQPGNGLQPHIVLPADYKMEPIPLAALPALPDHIRAKVRLDDAESFVLYVKAFGTPTTRIFATAASLADVKPGSSGGAKFTALLDYHEGGKDQKAARVAHTAEYPLPLSLEFSTWLAGNGKAMTQMEFVSFIEANCVDVVTPDSASLMELALNFEANSAVTFRSKVNRVTGGKELVYEDKVEAGAAKVGQVKVPETMKLSLPVFEGGRKYPFEARMEWRPADGRLRVTYHLQRPHDGFRTALLDVRAEIAEALEAQILTGSSATLPSV